MKTYESPKPRTCLDGMDALIEEIDQDIMLVKKQIEFLKQYNHE